MFTYFSREAHGNFLMKSKITRNKFTELRRVLQMSHSNSAIYRSYNKCLLFWLHLYIWSCHVLQAVFRMATAQS